MRTVQIGTTLFRALGSVRLPSQDLGTELALERHFGPRAFERPCTFARTRRERQSHSVSKIFVVRRVELGVHSRRRRRRRR